MLKSRKDDSGQPPIEHTTFFTTFLTTTEPAPCDICVADQSHHDLTSDQLSSQVPDVAQPRAPAAGPP
ncbi:hypothetical protein IMZ48_15965 [Candidatus Bathyarchaeota archaeon]|nr:hypothetical protein [Candidatus Bathyarchaeota archaeon]